MTTDSFIMCIMMLESEDAGQMMPYSLDSSHLYVFVVRAFILASVHFSKFGSILGFETANDAKHLCIDLNTVYYSE